jgi:hypothetical protein
MKTWLILAFGTMCIADLQGQCIIFQEKNGQVYTTCDLYSATTGSQSSLAAMHNQVTYKGTQFSTFPIWQAGTFRLDSRGVEIKGELAYNLFSNEVLCKLAGDSTTRTITPAQFTINGVEYTRQKANLPGVSSFSYFSKLYDGPTKFLVSSGKKLVPGGAGGNGYEKQSNVSGAYQIFRNYFIQKGNAQPEYINLTKKSLLDRFYDQSEIMARQIPDKDLTLNDVIQSIAYYDSLSTASQLNRHPLRNDAVFNQELHNRIIYPGVAWTQAVYSRVYAGFEVSELGDVKNVTILSPENAGFGFTSEVRQALEKIPRLGPGLAGTYALPVTFTYTNSTEKTGTHRPVNRLADEYLNDRTLLDEFVVPIMVLKPVIGSREVWGFYK